MDIIGKTFGRLVVLKKVGVVGKGQTIWLCQCECGKITTTTRGNLTSGSTKSCGCLRKNRTYTASCAHCGEIFVRSNNRQKYCSHTCVFLSHIPDKNENECWPWLGGYTSAGYGKLKVDGKYIGAHVYSYVYFNGNYESGLYICHICDNPACVNPNHLRAWTPKQNIQDSIVKGRYKFNTKYLKHQQ